MPASASNAFLKRILFAAAPKDVELQVMNEADAAAYLKEDSPAGEKVLVLSKTPQPLLAMVRSGIEIKEIILGNMGGAPGGNALRRRAFPPGAPPILPRMISLISMPLRTRPAEAAESSKEQGPFSGGRIFLQIGGGICLIHDLQLHILGCSREQDPLQERV